MDNYKYIDQILEIINKKAVHSSVEDETPFASVWDKETARRVELENDGKEIINMLFGQLVELRDNLAPKAHAIAEGWLVFIIVIITSDGIFNSLGRKFLPPSVLIALISAATVTIVGLFAIVLKGIFKPFLKIFDK